MLNSFLKKKNYSKRRILLEIHDYDNFKINFDVAIFLTNIFTKYTIPIENPLEQPIF